MTELTPAQTEILAALKLAYERYNVLVHRMIDVANGNYDSMIEMKLSIMTALSESLHEAGIKK